MKRELMWALAGMAVLADSSTIQAQNAPQNAPRIDTQVLLQRSASWNDIPYKAYPAGPPQLTTLRVTIPAHTAMPWHIHAMPNATYILSGHVTVEERGTGRKAIYYAGEAFAESINNVHRGVTDSEPVVVIITYAGTPGQPVSVPVAGERE
jgi:quercetin dioxygenase-like cupin family protein